MDHIFFFSYKTISLEPLHLAMKIIITSPSLNVNTNVSGVSAVANFIIRLNPTHQYIHFEVGKKDAEGRGIKRVLNIIKMYFKWTALLLTTRHFIHFNFPVDKRSVIRDVPMIALAKLLGKRMLIHLHGGEFLLNDNVPGWITFMIDIALKGKRPVIFLSEAENKIVAPKFKCHNSITLPNAIDISDAEQFERTFTDNDLPTLLFLGRIHPEKGIVYIYEALALLKKQGINFKFFLAGKGPLQEEYIQKLSDLLGDKFEFKGVVSGTSKTDTFKQCNIFLLPSFWEGLPIALLEAMSFGLVPITTGVGAMDTVVITDKSGIIVGVRSAEDIAAAITKIASDSMRMKTMSRNARELIFKNYNPYKYIEILNKIYQYE